VEDVVNSEYIGITVNHSTMTVKDTAFAQFRGCLFVGMYGLVVPSASAAPMQIFQERKRQHNELKDYL
jgi:hypothetical protein